MTEPQGSVAGGFADKIVIESLHARLKVIEDENKAPKSFLERVQKHGGPVALAIGIFLSVVSIFDTFINKPQEDLRKAQLEFNDRIGAITKIRLDYVQLSLRDPKNHGLIQATGQTLTPQIMANVQSAGLLLPELKGRVGAPQLIVLTHEAASVGDLALAERFIDHAMTIERLTPNVRADVVRYKARVLFMTGRHKEARAAFEMALATIKNHSVFGISTHRALITADWLVSELVFGDCESTGGHTQDLITHLEHPEVMEGQRRGVLVQLGTQFYELNRLSKARCAVPPVLMKMMASLQEAPAPAKACPAQ